MTNLLRLVALTSVFVSLPALAQYKPSMTIVREVDSIHVNRDGSTQQTSESTMRIETAQGIDSGGERKIYYNSTLEDIEVLEAYTLQPDGTRISVSPDKIRTQDAFDNSGAAIFSDAKHKVIIYPMVDVGSQLYYRYKSVQHTPLFPGHFTLSNYFSPHIRYEDITLNLTHDEGIAFQFDVAGALGGRVDSLPADPANSRRYRFTYRQDSAYPSEAGQLGLSDFAPHINVSSFPDYKSLGRAYQARAYPKTKVTDDIESLAKEVVAGAKGENEKVRRLYNWVSRNIRYVGIYMGAGGFVPHDAASILANRYGDCKDHVVILESLLRAVGIESTPALINLGSSYRLPKLPVMSPFNHVITYIPTLHLYLDSTAQFAPMGTLPSDDMDKPVLFTASGLIGRTPAPKPGTNYSHTTIRMRLASDGGVSGHSTTRKVGAQEVASRSIQFNNANQDTAKLVNRYLARFGETGTGIIHPTKPLDLDSAWEFQAEYELEPVVNIPGRSAFTIPVGLASAELKQFAKHTPPRQRRFPASCESVGYREDIEIGFPPGVRVDGIPAGVSFTRGAHRYKSSAKLTGSKLHVIREYTETRSDPICAPNEDDDVRALLTVLKRDLRGQIFIR